MCNAKRAKASQPVAPAEMGELPSVGGSTPDEAETAAETAAERPFFRCARGSLEPGVESLGSVVLVALRALGTSSRGAGSASDAAVGASLGRVVAELWPRQLPQPPGRLFPFSNVGCRFSGIKRV